MLIAVLADKAPAGIATSSLPSGEVTEPPDASIFLVTGLPTGVPMAVMAGVGLPESEPVEGEEPFLQAKETIRHRTSSKTGLGEKLERILKLFAQNYYPAVDSTIERKLPLADVYLIIRLFTQETSPRLRREDRTHPNALSNYMPLNCK